MERAMEGTAGAMLSLQKTADLELQTCGTLEQLYLWSKLLDTSGSSFNTQKTILKLGSLLFGLDVPLLLTKMQTLPRCLLDAQKIVLSLLSGSLISKENEITERNI